MLNFHNLPPQPERGVCILNPIIHPVEGANFTYTYLLDSDLSGPSCSKDR